MSLSSERGKTFELEVAKLIRRKTGNRAVRDSRSGALWNRPSDISTDLPDIHIECKDHETVKVKEWMRQAEEAASFTQRPVVAFRMDEEILTIMRLNDVLDLFVEITDLRLQVDDLMKPVDVAQLANRRTDADIVDVKPPHTTKITAAVPKTMYCRNGHIATSNGRCLTKGCPFSSGYKAKKKKS